LFVPHDGLERCAYGERACAGTVAIMAWALWLSAPVAATGLAALWVWWRGRPVRTPSVVDAMRQHSDYLAALVVPVRGTVRTEPSELRDGS
jgi:hypothetical protein